MLTINNNCEKAKMYSGLSLAFIGDSVYELLVREHLMENGSIPVNKLHLQAVEYVKASSQAKIFDYIIDKLNNEEKDILMRGRNSSTNHIPKGAHAIEYRKATGLEALFGWLYLEEQYDRINELFKIVLEII